ncbi:chemotaxis protein CheB [Dokdonia sp. Hel_I_53]|uniref:chemotaxis protein CheB n=1 Tax=Dokdonia sp. Hel_I_53 TaxID=1566287 RepID=UPI00119C4D40|nr:chemotaxis protein CheB [Dokdonia sp. Hel_I_53]TVZ53325.1 two-component system CheB/CheR fusion protein [Dokdonia sp. Hel_I_53]
MKERKHIIVAVGASAGGLDALNGFFDNVVENADYSYIIIQHLSPDHKSLMAELLAKKTNVPIVAVSNDSEIKRSHIYVIPPTMNLIIENNHLILLEKPKSQKLNLPIDMFMESLSKAYGKSAVGIILSGTGSDGTKGVRAIKEAGGVVFVQQPDEAGFDGMPTSAIATGVVDYILPAGEMIDEIYRYFQDDDLANFESDISNADLELLREILNILHKQTNINFNYYKRPTILRRTERRIKTLKMDGFEEYLGYLKIHPDEIEILYKEFLIGVTNFFRDRKAWNLLETETIPELVNSKSDGDTLKVWDVACSTGEEAYSLAILFEEEIQKQDKDILLKIFATDISEEHIKIASLGKFKKDIESNISPKKLDKYFVEDGEGYIINPDLRKRIIFSNHDILKDPPFKNMDMVACRNLLIYLKPDVQSAVLHTLHYALRINGVMFLGSSESNTALRNYFKTVSEKFKIFKNIHVSERLHSELLTSNLDKSNFMLSRKQKSPVEVSKETFSEDVKSTISNTIINQFDVASVYIDSDFKVIDAMGSFSKYAELPSQGFTLDLLKMLPDSIKTAVNSGARKARRSRKDFIFKDVITQKAGNDTVIDVLVKPVFHTNDEICNYVITFIEQELNPDLIFQRESLNFSNKTDERITDLIEEIEETRSELKKALEDAETSNEELQTLNEELLASNEELQSTNEELQSVNEELHTVNVEHVEKMDDLAMLNADMDNLLNSTQIATIFLDRGLTIRKFTPSIQQHFKLLKQDVGRPIDHFLVQLGDGKKLTLKEKIEKVMKNGNINEVNITNNEGKTFIRRISPFYTNFRKIEGAVITFIDITKTVESQNKLKESQKKFKEFYENDPVMHASVDPSTGQILECNNIFIDTLKLDSKKEAIGKRIFNFYSDESKTKALKLLDQIQKTGFVEGEQMTMINTEGEEIPIILNSELVIPDVGPSYTRSTLVDISDLQKAQQLMYDKNAELLRINSDLEQFVSICSHDLQEPLGTIKFSSDVILKKFGTDLEPKVTEYLGYIYGAAGRMAEQIKGLLEHSRIGQDLERTQVDVEELLNIVEYDLGKRLKECNGKLHVGKMPVIQAYKVELRLLFQNLIGNSLKYCREGINPEVRVSAFEDGDFWTFSISDNGIGIAEDDLENVFKIFGRAATQHKYEGTGVGLAHCEKIVKLHEGTIWADSQVGVGSTFYFKIKK